MRTLAVLCALALLVGCGQDPIADCIENVKHEYHQCRVAGNSDCDDKIVRGADYCYGELLGWNFGETVEHCVEIANKPDCEAESIAPIRQRCEESASFSAELCRMVYHPAYADCIHEAENALRDEAHDAYLNRARVQELKNQCLDVLE